mgnify:CR=1 FL=1
MRILTHRSTAGRMSLWLTAGVAVVFVASLTTMFFFSRQALKTEMIERVTRSVEGTALGIDSILRHTETAVANLKWLAEQKMDSPADLSQLRQHLLETNSDIRDCAFVVVSDSAAAFGESDANVGQWHVWESTDSTVAHLTYSLPLNGSRRMMMVVSTTPNLNQVVVTPSTEKFNDFERLHTYMLFITVGGLLLLLVFCRLIISFRLRPLKLLARSAHRIADGQYDTPIPRTRRFDELGQLQNSFSAMQLSLADYLERIAEQTNHLSRQTNELEQAYGQVKSAERVKDAFLSNVTDRLEQPVAVIVSIVDRFSTDHHHMEKAEIDQLLSKMKIQTNTVTHLLDSMINGK